jgi:Ca2+:H+ antiporter
MPAVLRREIHLVALVATAIVVYFAHGRLAEAGGAVGWLVFAWLFVAILWGAFAVVRHAEALAHRLGEPYGTLVLTLAVTAIEVAFIVSATLSGQSGETLARDTVFAVLMITLNGLAGLCLLIGGLRYGEQEHNLQGTRSFLAVIVPVAVLVLILPNFTTTKSGPYLTVFQSAVIGVLVLALYGVFLLVQTVRHAQFFQDPHARKTRARKTRARERVAAGAVRNEVYWHTAFLLATLVPVIFLAEELAAETSREFAAIGTPAALAGVVLALLVLSPEGMGGLRAAAGNEIQRAINIVLGSALATVGLTVPAVLAIGVWTGRDIALGLAPEEMVLLALTFAVTPFTFGSLRTNVLVGAVHFVLFVVFIALIFDP